MQTHQPLQDVLLAKEDLSPWEIQHHQPKCPKLVYRRENVKKTIYFEFCVYKNLQNMHFLFLRASTDTI